ncbi:hypothetical protein N7507_002665 [Penicillium longicatenatum]|nr:hypothetical protein N7507_002665 [Penicillium longicatenatum]
MTSGIDQINPVNLSPSGRHQMGLRQKSIQQEAKCRKSVLVHIGMQLLGSHPRIERIEVREEGDTSSASRAARLAGRWRCSIQ